MRKLTSCAVLAVLVQALLLIALTPRTSSAEESVICYAASYEGTGRVKRSFTGSYSKSVGHITAGSDILGNSWRGYMVFDVSDIPDNAIIESIHLYLYTQNVSISSSHVLDFNKMITSSGNVVDPRYYAGDLLWGYTLSYGESQYGASHTIQESTGWHSLSLTDWACQDLTSSDYGGSNALANDKFPIGVSEYFDDDEYCEFSGYDSSNRPYIYVVYSLPETHLSVSHQYPEYPNSGGSIAYEVTIEGGSPDARWDLGSTPSWLSPSRTYGYGSGQFTMYASENTGQARGVEVKISCSESVEGYVTIYVYQEAAATALSVSPTNLSFTKETGTQSIQITISGGDPNASWSISSLSNWVDVNRSTGSGSGNVDVTVERNSGPQRENTFYINCSNASPSSIAVSVTQNMGTTFLSVTPLELTFPQSGGSKNISVEIEGGDPNAYWYVTEVNPYLTVNPAAGYGSSSVSVIADENLGADRNTLIVINCDGALPDYKDVYVNQDGSTTSVGMTATHIPSDFSVEKLFPNPFNSSTTITVGLPQPSNMSIEVFDVVGRSVAALMNGHVRAGYQSYTFDASGLPSGTYFIQVRVPNKLNQVMRVVLLK